VPQEIAKVVAKLEVVQKTLKRSHQRSGRAADGTLLSSGTRQATLTFTPPVFHKLKLAAHKNGVSFSEMVRQCVSQVLDS
jgi:hypothetical protein